MRVGTEAGHGRGSGAPGPDSGDHDGRPRPGAPPAGARPGLPAPRPLPRLPLFPALAGYPAFAETIRRLGFRHVAELLRAPVPAGRAQDRTGGRTDSGTGPAGVPGGGFRVLDGLRFPGRGRSWLTVIGRAHV